MRRASPIALWCTLMTANVAHAHDANLARWDVSTEGAELLVRLRTSGSGLSASLSAADPETDGVSRELPTTEDRLTDFFREVLWVEEDGLRLALLDGTFTLGHEAVATLRYGRAQTGPLTEVHLDLSGYTDRKNQHHLVFIHHDDERERTMLQPGSGYTLDWSATTPQATQTNSTPQRQPIPSWPLAAVGGIISYAFLFRSKRPKTTKL